MKRRASGGRRSRIAFMAGAVVLAGAVVTVALVGVVAAKDSQTPPPQPDLGDPVASLTCPPFDQIGRLFPYGSYPHPSANLAVQEFVQKWPVLSAKLFTVDYSDGFYEHQVIDVLGERRAIVRLEKGEGGWAVSDFAACNTLLVDGIS